MRCTGKLAETSADMRSVIYCSRVARVCRQPARSGSIEDNDRAQQRNDATVSCGVDNADNRSKSTKQKVEKFTKSCVLGAVVVHRWTISIGNELVTGGRSANVSLQWTIYGMLCQKAMLFGAYMQPGLLNVSTMDCHSGGVVLRLAEFDDDTPLVTCTWFSLSAIIWRLISHSLCMQKKSMHSVAVQSSSYGVLLTIVRLVVQACTV